LQDIATSFQPWKIVLRTVAVLGAVGSSGAELEIAHNFSGREAAYTTRVEPDLYHRQIANHFDGSADGVIVGRTLNCLTGADVSITSDAINSIVLHTAFPLASTGDAMRLLTNSAFSEFSHQKSPYQEGINENEHYHGGAPVQYAAPREDDARLCRESYGDDMN
jgi:hypothetical protein